VTSNAYEGLLRDIAKEINIIAMDKSIWQDSDFNRGYQAGMMVIMKAIQDEIAAFDLPMESINLINVDEWFREGKDYDPSSHGVP
jgi:hypothetical protein